MLKQSPFKIIGICILLVFTLAVSIWLFLYRPFSGELRADYQNLESGNYELVFLSMYPIDNYTEEAFATRYGMSPLLTSYEIPNFSILKKYVEKINDAGTASIVYLGVRPEKLDAAQLAELLLTYPHITFEVLLPYPSMDYWLSLSEQKCNNLLEAYREFIPPMLNHGNVFLYCFSNWEWLISNKDNYEDYFLTTPEISEYIMFHMGDRYIYYISDGETPATASIDSLAALIAQNRDTPIEYPDLSDWNIVFFGDSVIGNYTDNTCISHVVGTLTGAGVYNMGYGGTRMTTDPEGPLSMPEILNAFLSQNPGLLPEDCQARIGMTEYYKDAPTGQLCFVINYGLNDYFSGLPMYSDDPYDVYTFMGATRASVKALREAHPDAYILLNTPNFTSYFEYGTEPHYESYTIVDYVNALKELATELDISLLDNYNELGWNAENLSIYSDDGCHPNEVGRFLIGQRIAQKLGDINP